MDKEKIKNFIITQRQNGVPDDQIYSFLQEKGVISKPEVDTPPKPTVAEKVADFTGGKELAQGFGQMLAQKGTEKRIEETQKQQFDIQSNLISRIRENKLQGLDTSRLENALNLINEEIAKTGQRAEELLNPNELTNKEVLGSALQLVANAIPGVGAEKAGMESGKLAVMGGASELLAKTGIPSTIIQKGTETLAKKTPLLAKIGAGAGTGYAYDVAQNLKENKTGTDVIKPGVGTVVGGALPVAGILANNLVLKPLSRIVKGLGAGFSGAGVQDLNNIISNPYTAQKVSNALKKEGNIEVLKSEVKNVMDGISQIRRESNIAFGQGLDELKATDIEPKTFRNKIQTFLDDNGFYTKSGKKNLTNVEFSDPKNIKKANELIGRLQNVELNGKELRKLSDDIENAQFKTATSDERIAFNRFTQDLSSALKGAISETTPKLKEINAKWSQDRQLIDAIQSIFGNVKFKSLDEINTIAKKISGISSEGGISPEIVDNFFKRIGQNPAEFKTSESVRKIMSKNIGANKLGLNVSEIMQSLSGGIITPNLVKNIAILTGKSEPVVKKIIEKGSPTAKKLLLNLITQNQKLTQE